MNEAFSNSKTWSQFLIGIVALLVGLLVGWFIGSVPRADAAIQMPSSGARPTPVETACGTISRVLVGSLPHPISEGRTAMVDDFITSYILTSGEEPVRNAVVQGIKIRLSLSQVDRSGRGSVASVEVRDRITGSVLASKRLSNAERRQNKVIIPLTFSQPYALSSAPTETRLFSLYADTTPIKNGVSGGIVSLTTEFLGYKSANVWVDTSSPPSPVVANY